MSTAPVLTKASEPVPAPVKEIPSLSDAYRKAHKSYVLVAGLLASWELIGITLNTKEKWGVELKSPAAVPLILFTLRALHCSHYSHVRYLSFIWRKSPNWEW